MPTTIQLDTKWNFSYPPTNLRNSKLKLLTISGIGFTAKWNNKMLAHVVAWAPYNISNSNPMSLN